MEAIMKKITKLMGLLFVAGAMFIGCKQDADIRTTDFKLSSGQWEVVTDGMDSEDKIENELRVTYNSTYKAKQLFSVSGDDITIISITKNGKESVILSTLASQTDIDKYKQLLEAKKKEGDTVSVEENTVTLNYSHTATAEEIAAQNAKNPKVSDLVNGFPQGVEIFTNRKKTEYKIYYPNKTTTDSSVNPPLETKNKTSLTFKKQK
jgi:hypothetical protein